MSSLPRVVFFGSDAICLPALRYLHAAEAACELVAVVSQPDRRQGRGKQMQPNPVSEYARKQGIPLKQPEKPDGEMAAWLASEAITVAFVMAYGHFLPKAVREAPQYGMLNFHGSILPKYRGASPVESAIAEGEQETGVCLMEVVREMDGGGVADCERVAISATVTAPELRAFVGEAVVPLLERNLSAVLLGELIFRPQAASSATYCRKVFKQDGAIDFDSTAVAIYNRMRAFTPWPGAYFDHEDVRIKVGAARVLRSACSVEPGVILSIEKTVLVATGDGVIEFSELQRPGGRMLPVSEFLRGYSMQAGDLLIGGKSEPLVRNEP